MTTAMLAKNKRPHKIKSTGTVYPMIVAPGTLLIPDLTFNPPQIPILRDSAGRADIPGTLDAFTDALLVNSAMKTPAAGSVTQGGAASWDEDIEAVLPANSIPGQWTKIPKMFAQFAAGVFDTSVLIPNNFVVPDGKNVTGLEITFYCCKTAAAETNVDAEPAGAKNVDNSGQIYANLNDGTPTYGERVTATGCVGHVDSWPVQEDLVVTTATKYTLGGNGNLWGQSQANLKTYLTNGTALNTLTIDEGLCAVDGTYALAQIVFTIYWDGGHASVVMMHTDPAVPSGAHMLAGTVTMKGESKTCVQHLYGLRPATVRNAAGVDVESLELLDLGTVTFTGGTIDAPESCGHPPDHHYATAVSVTPTEVLYGMTLQQLGRWSDTGKPFASWVILEAANLVGVMIVTSTSGGSAASEINPLISRWGIKT